MNEFCDYHPAKPAHWNCSNCEAMICSECVLKRDKGGYRKGEFLYLCPKCNIPVTWLGIKNVIEPFWSRLPKIFRYPFFPHPLILMLILSVVSYLFSGPGLFKMLMRGAAWMVTLKYSFELLKTTASGNLKPPKISSQTIHDDYQQVFKQFGIFILIFMISVWLMKNIGFSAGIIFTIVAYFFLPAMIILLVTTDSLLRAVNPVFFFQLAVRIGPGYFLMLFFLMLLGSAPVYLGQYFIQYLPSGLHLPLFSFAQSYYTIISYHLMGYVILQNHEKIGYKVDQYDFEDPTEKLTEATESNPETAVLKEVNILIQGGKLDEAVLVIEDTMRQQRLSSLELSDRYYHLLKMKKLTNKMAKHGIDYLDLLINANNKQKALEVYLECQKIDPGFLPTAASLFKIGEWLNETGKAKASIDNFSRLIKAYPKNPLVPKTYFRAAQIFNDRLMNPDKAKKILTALLKQFPENEIVPQAKKYLSNM